ncbi:hypothetical protein [Natronoarchaeum rubrum]|uniref:hypothetical protein n=1 Tax=Natronoarchaeum rubrum TaxID=755311 RepID=UPI002112A22A|nr:hypothetical protein [Natronoarchaeum rubrum]
MNRRNVLAGIGALTAGGGAIFGSGAFSSVEATRNARFSVAADSSAEIGFEGDGDYITTVSSSNGNQVIEFDFQNLNDKATTTFTGLLTITNNASDGNEVTVYIENSGEVGNSVDFEYDESSIVGADSTAGTAITNGSSIDVDVVFDTTAGDPSTVDSVTIHAEDTA